MNEKFKNMWNLDKLFENIVILNVFLETIFESRYFVICIGPPNLSSNSLGPADLIFISSQLNISLYNCFGNVNIDDKGSNSLLHSLLSYVLNLKNASIIDK
jgi:hypothetical protein